MSQDEHSFRVVFAALRLAARLAARSVVPLKEFKRLLELAYYAEFRRRSLKLREIGERLGISMSKVGLLSKQLKEHYSGFVMEHELPRRIMTLLWGLPLSLHGLAGALADVESGELAAAVQSLLERGLIREVPGPKVVRYTLAGTRYRLVGDDWMARIDALNNLVDSLEGTVEARFFDADERAFARTLGFRVRPEDLPKLFESYERIFELVGTLDDDANEATEVVPMTLSFFFAPTGDAGTEDG